MVALVERRMKAVEMEHLDTLAIRKLEHLLVVHHKRVALELVLHMMVVVVHILVEHHTVVEDQVLVAWLVVHQLEHPECLA